jgi:tetratricopeptide (TPR) repeat protein
VPEKQTRFGATYESGKSRLLARIAEDESAIDPRLELAQLAYVAGDFGTAEATLRAASELAPDNARVFIRLGDVLHETDRHEAALESYLKAERLASGTTIESEARLERELCERDCRLVFTPLAELEADADGLTASVSELNRLGGLYLVAGRVSDAAETFRRAVQMDESSLQAALNLGFVQGLASVEPEKLKGSVKELTAAAERFGEEPRLQLHLAELYEASSLYDAAIQRIMRALLNSKTCLEAYDLAARYATLGGGREAPLEERIDEIVADAEKGVTDASDTDANRLLALALIGRARYRNSAGSPFPGEGKEDLGRACELLKGVSDADEEAAVRLAECRERLGEIDGAERLLRDAAERHSDSYRPHFELGGLRLRTGRPDEAVELFAKALEVAPEEAALYQSLRFALASARKLRLSELAARKELDSDPKSAAAHLRLGKAYLDAMRHDDAVEILVKATELRPDRADTHVALGRALARVDRKEEAEASFRKAIELDANLAEAHKGLGNLLVDSAGRMREGLEALDKYRELKAKNGRD